MLPPWYKHIELYIYILYSILIIYKYDILKNSQIYIRRKTERGIIPLDCINCAIKKWPSDVIEYNYSISHAKHEL